MPIGPSSTNALPYLPPDYHSSAYPGYPTVATHKTISTQTGLHTGFAVREVSKAADQDLDNKKELVDYLPNNTQIIVFNEACGYKGQWAQVLVLGPDDGFYKYTNNNGEEVKRLFVMKEHLEKLPGFRPSHPIVKPVEIDSPMYDILPSNWRNEPIEIPFFDNRTCCYCIVVERLKNDASEAVLNSNTLENYLKAARFKGTKLLLDYYQKDYPSGLFRWAGILEAMEASWDDIDIPLIDDSDAGTSIEEYFSFAYTEEYHIEPRTYDTAIKFLIRIPQIYFDTYKVKKTSQPIVQTFLDAEENVNKFLDQNDGLINTNVLRDWMRSGFTDDEGNLPDWMQNKEDTVEIFGEEYASTPEDEWGRTILDPEEISREQQERINTSNEIIGDIPEHLYNRLIPGEAREAIEATLKGIRDAYETAEGVAGDVTEGLQATIDTINLVTDTLDAAPDIDSVNDAMFRAFQDPTVDIANISDTVVYGAAENEAQKRRYQDRNLGDILPLLENTLILRRYEDLLQFKLANDNIVTFYSGALSADESTVEDSYMYGGGRPIPPIPPELPSTFEIGEGGEAEDAAMAEYERELEEYEREQEEYESELREYEREHSATQERHSSTRSRKDQAIKNRDEAMKALDEIESVIKQTEFYVELTFAEFLRGTTEFLPRILEHLEEEKDQFDGSVDGWMPEVDAGRIKQVYSKVTEFLMEQAKTINIKSEQQMVNAWNKKKNEFWNETSKIEFALTKNHRLVYIGCQFKDDVFQEYVHLHRYGTGQPINITIPDDASGFNPLEWEMDSGGVFSGFDNFVRNTPPLESQTIMAYVWKLNEIMNDSISKQFPGPIPITDWGSKYVYPRPKFIAKPKQLTDVTKQRKELGAEITKFQANEDRDLREDGQLKIKQAIQAVNDIEHNVDSTVGEANSVIKDINSSDDAINNFFAAQATRNPYLAATIKCLVPKLDFDLLPEIPDLDLEWLRNPLMKTLELWDTIVPPGDIWAAIRAGLEKALEQALKLLYVTLVKMLLEMLVAVCLKIQADLMEAALEGVDSLLDHINPANENPSIEDAISNRATEQQSTVIKAFNETGIFESEHFNMAEAIKQATDLFTDVSGLLSPAELCKLVSGDPPEYILSLITNLIAVKHRHFIEVINSKSKIIELFSVFGTYLDKKICDEILSINENRAFGDSYKNLACNISSELDRVRRELYACNPDLTAELIDEMIARENEANLETVKVLIDSFNSDTFDVLSSLNIESAAADHAMKIAIDTFFQPAKNTLKQELTEYPKYLTTVAELAMPSNPEPPYNATTLEVLAGTRNMNEMPRPTEIAGFLRKQLQELELMGTSGPFRIVESNNGFVIKLVSPWWFNNDFAFEEAAELYNFEDLDQSFEMQFQLHNKIPSAGSVALDELVDQVTPAQVTATAEAAVAATEPWELTDKYSLIVRNIQTNENTFMYSKPYEPKEKTKNYIEQNMIPHIDFATSDNSLAPQQIYFQTFIESKLGNEVFKSEADRENFRLFTQHGIFSQIMRDTMGFMGKKVASSKYFEFSNKMENSKLVSELEALDMPSKIEDLFGLEKIKSEAIKKIKKNQGKDLPEPPDATIQRKHFLAFEVGVMEQCIKSIVRIYIIEFLIKSIFSSSTFELSERIDEIFYDYILQKIISDLPTKPWSSKIFNYKFTYLARGIYQDSLERPLVGDDHDISHIITKHIIEQYEDVRKTFNELVPDLTTTEHVTGEYNRREDERERTRERSTIGAATATRGFLNQLPVRNYDGRNYDWVQDFTGPAGTLEEKQFKNGNFYFERYLKITDHNGSVTEVSANVQGEFPGFPSIANISYNLRLMYLFPYGSLQTVTDGGPVNLDRPSNINSSDARYSLNVSTILRDAENIEIYHYTPEQVETTYTEGSHGYMIPDVQVTSEDHYRKNLPLVTIANVEQDYNGNIRDFFTSYNIFNDPEVTRLRYEKLFDGTYDDKPYWVLDGFIGTTSTRGTSKHRLDSRYQFKAALLNKIHTIANNTQKREVLAKYWEEHTLGIGVMVHDEDWDHEKYWSSRGIPSDIMEDQKKIADRDGEGGSYIQDYNFFKDPNETLETYVDRLLSAFYSAFKTWLKDEEGDIEIVRIKCYAHFPVIEGIIIGNHFPETNLHAMMNIDEDVNFLFNYIFPIEKYKTLMSIYIVESMGDIPGLHMMFSGTKLELRSLFNTMDSRGKFNYRDRSKEKFRDNIQIMKDALTTPAPTRAFLEAEDEREERRGNINQGVATTTTSEETTTTTTSGGSGRPGSGGSGGQSGGSSGGSSEDSSGSGRPG